MISAQLTKRVPPASRKASECTLPNSALNAPTELCVRRSQHTMPPRSPPTRNSSAWVGCMHTHVVACSWASACSSAPVAVSTTRAWQWNPTVTADRPSAAQAASLCPAVAASRTPAPRAGLGRAGPAWAQSSAVTACHTRSIPSSPADANRCGNAGFHRTQLTARSCAPRLAHSAEEGGRVEQPAALGAGGQLAGSSQAPTPATPLLARSSAAPPMASGAPLAAAALPASARRRLET